MKEARIPAQGIYTPETSGHGECLSIVMALLLFGCGMLAVGQARSQPSAHTSGATASLDQVRTYLDAHRVTEALRMSAALSAQHKQDAQFHLALGVLLGSAMEYKTAELELDKANDLQPGTFEILFDLGQVSLRRGEFLKAEQMLNRALALKPESSETLFLLAQVLANESRPMDALALLVRAHKTAPDNMDVVLLMARISIAQRYYEDAIPLLESAIAVAPQRTDLRSALGESYLMADQTDKSIGVFKQLIGSAPTARSYTFLGLGYQRLGRFDEARQAFQEGLKLDAHNTACLFHLGFIAERQGDTAKAEARFREVLRLKADYPDALLELANLQVAEHKLPDAAALLRRYVAVSRTPATGYYKLAMVERSLQHKEAADRDLALFQTTSKQNSGGQFPNEHLYDYLDNRAKLAPQNRVEGDIAEIKQELGAHPDQPQGLYLLTEAYLKTGQVAEAKETVTRIDATNSNDYRVLTGVGVLLARYHLYDEAIQHFQTALQLSPGSDEIRFDLADAYFRKGRYGEARDALLAVTDTGREDDACLSLLGDTYAHLRDDAQATQIFHDAIQRNPDDDQNYLSLALLELRERDLAAAQATLVAGQARVPGSGKLLWGLGLVSALNGKTAEAESYFAHAVDVLPEWPGSYSTLGVFYFETGQMEKAHEVLERFKNSSDAGALNIQRIEEVLARSPAATPGPNEPLSAAKKQQLLQLALLLADRTL